MYKFSINEFLDLISQKLKSTLTKEDIFSDEIKVSHLKRIDKIFDKGIHYYLDPAPPIKSTKSSVFFRKSNFGDSLNIEAKKIVSKYEELKLSLNSTQKSLGIEINRELPRFTTKNDPKIVAQKVREKLYPDFKIKKRDFLKSFISKLAENNIYVFEFIVHPRRIVKPNIDGFFLRPNLIVIRRNKYFSSEILTLAHEIGHYLLDEEEVFYFKNLNKSLSKIEKWCWDFAHYFLIGQLSDSFGNLGKSNPSNDYNWHVIEDISKRTHLSTFSLFTTQLLRNKISPKNYSKVRNEIRLKIEKLEEDQKKILKQKETTGFAQPKPINSPLYEKVMRTAYYEGIVSEYDVIKNLNFKPNQFESFVE